MKLNELTGKKICILGFGREGQAMMNALRDLDVDITVVDRNSELRTYGNAELTNCDCRTGPNYLKNINDFDIIIKSPGIPPCKELEEVKEKITNSTQIFLDTIADTGAKVIGVTGSKGKSTTASLIYEILKASGEDVHLVGNIGKPAMDFIDEAKPKTWFVMEMSSFQLMDLTMSPHIAVITTFFPEHLDYHGSLEDYLEAKKHITRFQKTEDYVFFNADSNEAKYIAEETSGGVFPVCREEAPVSLNQINLIGTHNLLNITLAYAVAAHLNIPEHIIIDTIKSFKGLPHRLQSLGAHNGIEWIDDSISTTPETTIAALDALENVTTLILGGHDRGSDFAELGKQIAHSSVLNVILMGESAPRIRKAIELANANVTFVKVKDMKEAVECTKEETSNQKLATRNFLCLLSPASPSYDMFKDFEERGNEFRKWIFSD
ncbi:UDP-N-acetylmuramoyl-L-alanine--D-glutamate ligase [Patescibacteria group bacterium]|nr:UDP-N-acetylmuramoyl-L-alanine--D-glutamate ligase [Patescibacteria group bacterium]MBU2259166.1 UDP-N-acetylmuramoyl-L-alanine--D-glutamate ligase [Patescibacteria group bacterium]